MKKVKSTYPVPPPKKKKRKRKIVGEWVQLLVFTSYSTPLNCTEVEGAERTH